MFWDSQAWRGIEEYRQFVFSSPAAQIAGQLMGSTHINFFFDAVFVRSAGSQFATPWHQDESYWPDLPDKRALSFWFPMQDVNVENGCMWFVPGSHKEPELRPSRLIKEGCHIRITDHCSNVMNND